LSTKEQRDIVFKKIGYNPSPEQDEIHNCPSRIRLVAGGERAGKSKLSAMESIGRFWETPLLWLVAADYNRTRAEFTYICTALGALGVRFEASKNVDPGYIEVDGGAFRVVTKSAKDPRTLAMEAPDGIIVCEASQISYEDFLRLRGRLAEKRGWMLLSGTFESSLGWYPELFQLGQTQNDIDLTSFSLPTWTNRAVFPGGRDDPEIKMLESTMSQEWFMERFGGVPCPPKGIVFTEFSNRIHVGSGKEYEFDPTKEVFLMIDPGFATAYAVLAAQKRNDELYIVDEIYERGLVTSDIIKVCKQRPWWDNVTGGAIDIAARQHQGMPAPIEVWASEGKKHLRSQKISVRDSIEVVKRFLLVNPVTNKPLLHINARCQGLISEMGGCPNPIDGQTKVYKWKTDNDGNITNESPEDKNNHSCKALAYGIVSLFGFTTIEKRRPKIRFF